MTTSIVTGALCTLLSADPSAPPPPPPPPNIVIIFTDDQGYADVGVFGAKGFSTPHLDQLAADGMRFTDFYVAQPVCSASRAALLTGCYPNRIGIAGALGPRARHGINENEVTIAELCKSRGYATAIFGKWHLGHHQQFLPLQHGFDEYLGTPYSNDMWPLHPNYAHFPDATERRKRGYPDLPFFQDNEIIDAEVEPEDQQQFTRWLTEGAVDFINRNKDRPFFLYVPHPMPHVPLYTSEDYTNVSEQGRYGDVITEIDWSAGQILDALHNNDLDDNTLVIFTTDNGPWLSYGDHAGSALPLREGKGTTFEGGVRVPCIMRWPGHIPAGTECNEPVMTIDVLPTVAAIIDADLPDHVIDGRSILPLMEAEEGATSPHEALFFYYHANHLESMRSGKWKLHFPHGYRTMIGREPGSGGTPGKYDYGKKTGLELYDLAADVSETTDVAADNPEVVQRLVAMADAMRDDLGDKLTEKKPTGNRPPGRLPKQLTLFDGKGYSKWQHLKGDPVQWKIVDDAMEIVPGKGSIITRRAFRNFMLHLEFMLPESPDNARGQQRANSGVYIQRRYEVQILDSFGLEASKRDCGALYNFKAPDKNACDAPGRWQSYDITFHSPRWTGEGENARKTANARISVRQNGILIHNNVELPNKTGAGQPEGPEPGPIMLQDHGAPVKFRNIRITPLDSGPTAFRWIDQGDGQTDLMAGDRRVLRYMHAYDTSTPERAHETYKCYHHVFDSTGEHPITKGPGGLYTHHRGLFIGWNRLTIGDREYDTWHMKETTQRHRDTLLLEADDDSAKQAVDIDWCDSEGEPLIRERRELTVHACSEPDTILLLDFTSHLTPAAGDVLLNGDPEHAGFQFRAHNDVADGPAEVKATYLFHADGIDPRKDHDLPWVLMSYKLNGRQYNVEYLNHPDNPDSTIYSAYRDYGRFGAFPKVDVKQGETLTLKYRVWITEGAPPTREECQKMYEAYVNSVSAGSSQGTERGKEKD